MLERLQKIISASGLMSRRAAEDAIKAGRVCLNGKTAVLGEKADASEDEILVDGKHLPEKTGFIYLMLNKPKGYVSTMNDEKGRRNVSELVKDAGERVYPVGRLDMYSEGLLIMTNDGEFANRLMHPSHEVVKIYHTWVSGQDIGYAAELMRQPIEIDGYITSPAEVNILELYPDGALLSVAIHEGRNRQVRRLCEAAGLKVKRLVRVSEGGLELGELKSGEWRHLTKNELGSLLAKGEN